jgi:hypothetical protein
MTGALAYNKAYAFNAICPYYTMFPLEYPVRILRKHKNASPIVLDPFCGRGTTVYVARKLGVKSYGFDTSPIAAAIARAKLASATLKDILELGDDLVGKKPKLIPDDAFFKRAFSKKTLEQVCSLREGLQSRRSDAAAILRAAALGCLHGPIVGGDVPSYFSNQMPRTFASKPAYSLRFWKERGLFPPNVSVMDVIEKKLSRISDLESKAFGSPKGVKCLDARKAASFNGIPKATVTITSPPYYGMRTYVQDQWLRMWFLGGSEDIDYENENQLSHSGHDDFITDLATVWRNVANHSRDGAHLYVRFGTIASARSNAKKLLKASLEEAGDWKLVSVRNAKSAKAGKRQADQMGRSSEAAEEYDFHAILD